PQGVPGRKNNGTGGIVRELNGHVWVQAGLGREGRTPAASSSRSGDSDDRFDFHLRALGERGNLVAGTRRVGLGEEAGIYFVDLGELAKEGQEHDRLDGIGKAGARCGGDGGKVLEALVGLRYRVVLIELACRRVDRKLARDEQQVADPDV